MKRLATILASTVLRHFVADVLDEMADVNRTHARNARRASRHAHAETKAYFEAQASAYDGIVDTLRMAARRYRGRT